MADNSFKCTSDKFFFMEVNNMNPDQTAPRGLTGILQVLMLIMNRFVPSYWLVKWLWYRVYSQKVVSSSPRVCLFFYLYSIRLISFIIDVPRSLRNEILDHSFQKVDV